MDVAGRAGKVRAALAEAGCDALLVTHLPNIRWLTGFTGSAAQLLVRGDDLVLVTDGRYSEQGPAELAAAGAAASVEVLANPGEQDELIDRLTRGLARVGLESDHLTWARQRTLAAGVLTGRDLVATESLVDALRSVKDPGEVARIEAAAAAVDAALAAVLPLLLDRPTERAVALALDDEIRARGTDGPAFETIVATGANGARPHARPGERTVEAGHLVVVDAGAVVDGYRSDMTRTYSIGPPGPDARRLLDAVAAAQAAGVAAARAGVPARAVDAACRGSLDGAGLGHLFLHGTGHGIGLEVHEAPAVSARSAATLAAGTVVTIEPGAYLAGVGGVRFEDTVAVTEAGCRSLTHAPKDPVLS